MAVPRRLIVDPDSPGFYHCISRCVRRACLCGGSFEHRRDWIRTRLIELSGIFAIDVASYAVLSNHFHTVVRTDPHRADDWSNIEVLRRWSRLHAASVVAWAKSSGLAHQGASVRPRGSGSGVKISHDELEAAIRLLAKRTSLVRKLRSRLSSLSEFMKSAKEPIARRANREDNCTGYFWEGRFKSPRLLDDAAVLLGMIYVDLNLVRAALASTPEQSSHTSVQDRIHVWQHFQRQLGQRLRTPERASQLLTRLGDRPPCSEEDGIWLAPIDELAASKLKTSSPVAGLLPMKLADYLEIVDATGRIARDGKGSIPPHLPPILSRLGLDVERWAQFWRGGISLVGTAVGSSSRLAEEALRRKCKWVRGMMDVYKRE